MLMLLSGSKGGASALASGWGLLEHTDCEQARYLSVCRDLKKRKPQSGILFNALFNLDKFLKFENRDPFAMRAEAGEFAGLSEWDKFAKIEYYR